MRLAPRADCGKPANESPVPLLAATCICRTSRANRFAHCLNQLMQCVALLNAWYSPGAEGPLICCNPNGVHAHVL